MNCRCIYLFAAVTVPCLNAFSSSVPESLLSPPYSVTDRATANAADIVFWEGEYAIVKKPTLQTNDQNLREHLTGSTDDRFNAEGTDWYVVNTSMWEQVPGFVRRAGLVSGQVPGGFAVVRMTVAAAEQLSGELHRAGMACGALVRLGGDPVVAETVTTPVPVVPVAQELPLVRQLLEQIDASRIESRINVLSAIPTRYHSSPGGISVADTIADEYRALADGRDDVTVSKYDHAAVRSNQSSVVVRINGISNPDEIVVLGSHIDSVNWQDGSRQRSPGADDNASGTATNLEIFRVLMESGVHFERTVEFHAYAAEEIGLVGSAHIAKDYRAAGKNVIAMVQHDMNLYKEPGEPDKIWFVRENTDDAFNDLLATLVDRYVGIPWAKGSLTAGSSDHASWRRRGYATAFPFEHPGNYNPHIHSADDDTDHGNAFGQAAAFARLGAAYLAHFAGIN